MELLYLKYREMARAIVARLPQPSFRTRFAGELTRSTAMFHQDSRITGLHQEVATLLEGDFGHGLEHSTLVSIDAGALVQAEIHSWSESDPPPDIDRTMLLVQTAGLLHDVKRKEPQHALKGARFAPGFLTDHARDLTDDEIAMVAGAIQEHEAFIPRTLQHRSPQGLLIADALYDADKFRWGTDNFTTTLWDMVIYSGVSVDTFFRKYPEGMKRIAQIRHSFRTATGKQYGPEIIDLGIRTGNLLFQEIEKSRID